MHIIIESPHGPRSAFVPSGGIHDEATLVKCLIMTMAVEANRGADHMTLDIDLSDVSPGRLVGIAKAVGDRLVVVRDADRTS